MVSIIKLILKNIFFIIAFKFFEVKIIEKKIKSKIKFEEKKNPWIFDKNLGKIGKESFGPEKEKGKI